MTDLPLRKEDFVALLSGLPARVAVATSGGPDSLALVWGVKEAGLTPVALIVEHGLRTESAGEAAQVAAQLQTMGVEAHILPWEHDGIASRIHLRARAARYALLLRACQERGLDTLLFAHHRDDQAETILMRLAKGSGLAGLAGMARETFMERVRILRPLLDVPKARLVATCAAAQLAYVTDPSNDSQKYARGRLRRVGEALAQEGFTPERLIDLAARAGEAAAAIDFYARNFLHHHAKYGAGGVVRTSLDGWGELPRAVALQALSLCLMTIRRGEYPPERSGLIGALDYVLGVSEASAHSFYGCLIQRGEKQTLILREPSAIREVSAAADGILWDGRWVIENPQAGEIRPLGVQTRELLQSLAPGLADAVTQGRVRAALPALWQGDQLVAIPHLFADEKEGFRARILPPLWL